jgi:hypothetical protein
MAYRSTSHGSPRANECRSRTRRTLGWLKIAASFIAWLAVVCRGPVSLAQQPAANPAPAAITLSDQGRQIKQIAEHDGIRDFLMVDKHFGRIILFQAGEPVFSASALTGQSKMDRLPPDSLRKPFSGVSKLEDKVTPAGRFTVTRDFDPEYGEILEINEIQGVDWSIAIHRVYLATPSERRAERLDSPDHTDNHITHGCINVSDKTMSFLIRKLPKKKPAAVLYVLPHDASKTADYFSAQN